MVFTLTAITWSFSKNVPRGTLHFMELKTRMFPQLAQTNSRVKKYGKKKRFQCVLNILLTGDQRCVWDLILLLYCMWTYVHALRLLECDLLCEHVFQVLFEPDTRSLWGRHPLTMTGYSCHGHHPWHFAEKQIQIGPYVNCSPHFCCTSKQSEDF